MKGYQRLPMKNLLNGGHGQAHKDNESIPRRAVAWVVGENVFLTPRGVKELRELKERYGSRPCEHCRFWDGVCVLGEPDECKEMRTSPKMRKTK